MKSVYVLQPYYVGSKRGKSLALIIPSKIVKKFHLNVSTVFALSTDEIAKGITLKSISDLDNKEETELENSKQKIEVEQMLETPKNVS